MRPHQQEIPEVSRPDAAADPRRGRPAGSTAASVKAGGRLCDAFSAQSLPRPAKRRLSPSTLLAPLPVVLVSTATAYLPKEKRFVGADVAAFAWCGIVNSRPPMLSLSVRAERLSYTRIESNGEFVVNLVHDMLSPICDYCGQVSGRETDKFKFCGLHAVKAAEMKSAPALAESLLTLSCRVRKAEDLGSHQLFLAEILAVEAAEELMDEKGALHLERAGLVAYRHGHYVRLAETLGFFGYSLAREDVRRRRLRSFQAPPRRRKHADRRS